MKQADKIYKLSQLKTNYQKPTLNNHAQEKIISPSNFKINEAIQFEEGEISETFNQLDLNN